MRTRIVPERTSSARSIGSATKSASSGVRPRRDSGPDGKEGPRLQGGQADRRKYRNSRRKVDPRPQGASSPQPAKVSKPLKEHTNNILIKNGVSKSVFFLALVTLPLVFMALFLEYARLLDLSRQVEIIAFSNLIFALLLFVSDRKPIRRKLSDITARDVLVIGIWQSFAVLPGTSRSGASITGARFLNYGRKEAIIISAVLSIPAIVISSGYIGFKIFSSPDKIDIEFIIYAAIFSFIFSYLALKFFVKFGELFSFTPYVIYRLFLGSALLIVLNL